MITIDDPKIRDIFFLRKHYQLRDVAVFGSVALAILATIVEIAWVGPQSVNNIALVWINVAFIITLVITVAEIDRIQNAQQSLIFDEKNSVIKQGGIPLSTLKKIAKKADLLANSIKWVTRFALVFSTLFIILNSFTSLLRYVISLILSGEYLFLVTAHQLMVGAIFLQGLIVVLVVKYDYRLHSMNHLMKTVYKLDEDGHADITPIIQVKRDLEIATLALLIVDCPVIIAVVIISIIEIFLLRSSLSESLESFAIGFSTGALALHIIAANLIFMILPRLSSNSIGSDEMKVSRGRVIASFALIVAVGIAATSYFKQAPGNSNVVHVGVATWAGFGNPFAGRSSDYWPDLKVDAKVIDDARAREASFVSGQLDVMISSVDLFAQEAASGIPGKIILVTDVSNGGDGIVAKPSIPDVASLKGRKIAVTVGAPSQFLLEQLLRKSGLSMSDVNVVKVDDPQRAAEVFASGDVDAAVTWEPFLSQAAEKNGKIIATSKDAPDTIVDVLIASPALLERKQVLNQFVRGWLRAAEDMRHPKPETIAAIAKGFGVKDDEIEGMLAGIKIAGQAENAALLGGKNAADTKVGQLFVKASTLWQSLGLVTTPANPADRIDMETQVLFTK
jgi:NitT/TauT family transport system substrate-binding protein